jgi:protein-disulfide isomerase
MKRTLGMVAVLACGMFSSAAQAQITQPINQLFARPEMTGFRQQSEYIYTAPTATIAIKLRRGLLERANVELSKVDAARAGQIFGAVTGYGDAFSQNFAQYVQRNAQGIAQQPNGVSINAEEFKLTTQIRDGKLRFDVQLNEIPESSFEKVRNIAGNPKAPVVIRVYSDFECPFCDKLEHELMTNYRKNLPADVRLEYHHTPLESIHPRARPAAEASECVAEQGQFWAFHDALFMDRSWTKLNELGPFFLGVASKLGIDMTKFRACASSRKYKSLVDAGLAESAKLGVNGTPTVFVNGYRVTDAYDRATLERLINFARP